MTSSEPVSGIALAASSESPDALHGMVPESPQQRSIAIRCAVWGFVMVAIGYTIWTRAFVPLQYTAVAMSLLFVAGIFWDLKREGWNIIRKLEFLVTPVLLGLSLLSMYWLLFQAWKHGHVTYYSPGSLLPYSDAAGYLNGAKSLLTFGELGQYAARRPMGTCLIAAALGAGNQNYQTALILLSSLAGVATFFAAREFWLTAGVAGALLYLFFCNLVMLQWLVVFMAETPAYTFASLSFAFLLAGFRRRSFVQTLYGFGLLLIALSARPGAMFAIPLLGIYLIYAFSNTWRQALRNGAMVSLVAILLLSWSPLLVRKISPGGESQGELSYTLYGLAAGGLSWKYVFDQHPEIMQIASEGERARYVYSLVGHQFSADPALFFSSLVRAFGIALQHPASVFFGLVLFIPSEIPAILALIALMLLLPRAFGRGGPLTFLFWIAVSVLFSAPFLFDAGWRAYMATLPFQLGMSAAALPLALRWTRRAQERILSKDVLHDSLLWRRSALGFAILLLGAVTAFPLLAWAKPHAEVKSLIAREGNGSWQDELLFYNPGSGILIGAESQIPGVLSVPMESVIHAGDFARDLRPYYYVKPGNFMYFAQFLQRPNDGVYVLFDRVPETRPGYLKVSVRLLEQGGGFFLYQAEASAELSLDSNRDSGSRPPSNP